MKINPYPRLLFNHIRMPLRFLVYSSSILEKRMVSSAYGREIIPLSLKFSADLSLPLSSTF
jgi:hypothetical protein